MNRELIEPATPKYNALNYQKMYFFLFLSGTFQILFNNFDSCYILFGIYEAASKNFQTLEQAPYLVSVNAPFLDTV